MRTQSTSLSGAGWRARVAPVLALWFAASFAGCDALIDVSNPNNVKDEDLSNPTAAPALVSGVLNEVTDAWATSLTPYATATDELHWIGSRDDWKNLNNGTLSVTTNEFTDAAFPDVAEARWLADNAIKLIKGFDDAGTLSSRLNLARAYLYGAIIYMLIGDQWEDFVVSSDRETPGPPVGPANMASMYDKAIQYLTDGIAIAQAVGGTTGTGLVTDMRALRASATHRKAIWQSIRPTFPAALPVYAGVDAQAVADAQALIAARGGTDWAFKFTYAVATTTSSIGGWVNERLEHRIDTSYAVADASNKTITGVALRDPIDNVADGGVARIIADFCNISGTKCLNTNVGPLWVTSEREMYLILAEHAWVNSDPVTAETNINALRALDGRTAYNRLNPAHPTVGAMIQYHRKANTFYQGRRLSDMYRFGIRDPRWTPEAETINRPGTFLPITTIECRSNPNLNCT